MALILLRAFRHRENKDPTVKRLRFGCVQILAASERHRERRQPAVPVAPRGSDTSGLCRVLVLARTSKRRIRDPQAISDFEFGHHLAMRVRSLDGATSDPDHIAADVATFRAPRAVGRFA